MLSNIIKRCIITRRKDNIKTIVALFQQRNNSSTSNQNIVRSKLPDIEIPNVFIEDVIFRGLDKWGDKIAVVSYTFHVMINFLAHIKENSKHHLDKTLITSCVLA
ncbi:hypothetical protein ILUMI_17537 [Ignelater luminosus]|uniref:Uncharacterized protein n=1 Tax=Ignelater luminosus TaxID=2038154 RepID=A0A8K0CN38_IGNLU|nr:hypothetical protein ILUMI_17537 [Ignelater luminosus]